MYPCDILGKAVVYGIYNDSYKAESASSYRVSLQTALIAALIDAVMGTILAWVLVRYNFPGKQIMNGIIELPFALPTAVAGIALTHLTTTNGWLGAFLANLESGLHIQGWELYSHLYSLEYHS